MYSSCLHVKSGVVCPLAMQEQARQESHLACTQNEQNKLNFLEAKLYFFILEIFSRIITRRKSASRDCESELVINQGLKC